MAQRTVKDTYSHDCTTGFKSNSARSVIVLHHRDDNSQRRNTRAHVRISIAEFFEEE